MSRANTVQAIEREKRELLEETERLQQRSNRVTRGLIPSMLLSRTLIICFAEELFTLRSQRQDSSQKLAHLDVEVSELRMAAESSKVSSRASFLLKAYGQSSSTSSGVRKRYKLPGMRFSN